jgi:hypothetical protein
MFYGIIAGRHHGYLAFWQRGKPFSHSILDFVLFSPLVDKHIRDRELIQDLAHKGYLVGDRRFLWRR